MTATTSKGEKKTKKRIIRNVEKDRKYIFAIIESILSQESSKQKKSKLIKDC